MTIHEAIPAIINDIGAISKSKKNAQAGFMYRGIDDVMDALNPLLAKHGVFIVPHVLKNERTERATNKGGSLTTVLLDVQFTFYSSDGSSIAFTLVGEAFDAGDKATNKALSVAMKYACFQVFCIPVNDAPDPDADALCPDADDQPRLEGWTLSERQIARAYAIGKSAGYSPAQVGMHVRKKYDCELNELSKEQYDVVCNGYENAKKAGVQ